MASTLHGVGDLRGHWPLAFNPFFGTAGLLRSIAWGQRVHFGVAFSQFKHSFLTIFLYLHTPAQGATRGDPCCYYLSSKYPL